jgi:hypothetical protein
VSLPINGCLNDERKPLHMKVVFVNKDKIAAEEMAKKLVEKWNKKNLERVQKMIMQGKIKKP